jgi:hypothetical protein
MRDRHFMSQVEMLSPHRTPYTKIYDTPEIPQLLEDFAAHLRAQRWEGERLSLTQTNETPLLPVAGVFTSEVRAAIQALHGEDFTTFGYDDVVPPKLEPGDAYPATLLAEVGRLVERHERIGDLATRAQALQRKLKRAHEVPATSAPAQRSARVRALLGRARRRWRRHRISPS